MQTTNRLLDDFAKIVTTAAGAAQGAKREVESLARGQLERLLSELDLVPREEFEAVKAVAQAARTECEALQKKVAALEARTTAPRKSVVNRPVRRGQSAAVRRRSS